MYRDFFHNGGLSDRTYQIKDGEVLILLFYLRPDHSLTDGHCADCSDFKPSGNSEYKIHADDHVYHLFPAVFGISVLRFYMDGATLPRRFSTVVFPLLQPAIVSCVITQGLWIWNDYFYPMVFISKKVQYSLPVGMLQFLGDKENPAQWNVLFAACVLCALPLIMVFLALQKQFVNGIAAGAVKG